MTSRPAEAKWTPGPWHWSQARTMQHLMAGAHGLAVSMPAPNSKTYFREGDGVREANARLISAAPELADLARNVAGFDDSLLQSANLNLLRATLSEFRDQARAAIDKAMGREP